MKSREASNGKMLYCNIRARLLFSTQKKQKKKEEKHGKYRLHRYLPQNLFHEE